MVGGRVGFGRIQFEAVARSTGNGYKKCSVAWMEKISRELEKGFLPPSPGCNRKEMVGMG
jgi:hypothetical protein